MFSVTQCFSCDCGWKIRFPQKSQPFFSMSYFSRIRELFWSRNCGRLSYPLQLCKIFSYQSFLLFQLWNSILSAKISDKEKGTKTRPWRMCWYISRKRRRWFLVPASSFYQVLSNHAISIYVTERQMLHNTQCPCRLPWTSVVRLPSSRPTVCQGHSTRLSSYTLTQHPSSTLRRIYQDEYCESVLSVTLLYQDQISQLDVVWSPETTDSDNRSTFLIDKDFALGMSFSMYTSSSCRCTPCARDVTWVCSDFLLFHLTSSRVASVGSSCRYTRH